MIHQESQHRSVSDGPQEQPWRLCAAQSGVNIGAYLEFCCPNYRGLHDLEKGDRVVSYKAEQRALGQLHQFCSETCSDLS